MKYKKKKKEIIKYLIVIYKNKKKYKTLHKKTFQKTILRLWDDEVRFIKPRFYIEYGKRGLPIKYELALLYPKDKTNKIIYIKDDLGRNKVIELMDEKHKIKKIVDYYIEQTVFDLNNRKRLRYFELLAKIKEIKEFTQLFTLNNKLIILDEKAKKLIS